MQLTFLDIRKKMKEDRKDNEDIKVLLSSLSFLSSFIPCLKNL